MPWPNPDARPDLVHSTHQSSSIAYSAVRSAARVLGSTLRRSRRARGDTFIVTGTPPSVRSCRALKITVDEMMFEFAGLILGDRPSAHRHAGFMHGIAIAADQIMPVRQIRARRTKPVGAG